MCLKISTSYNTKPAIAVRVENVPNIDWTIYHTSFNKMKDVANFRQPREFRVSDLLYTILAESDVISM